MKRIVTVVLVQVFIFSIVVTSVFAEEVGNYQGNGDPGGFLNIIPPGQKGNVNIFDVGKNLLLSEYPTNFNDQTEMYESIVYNTPVSENELTNYFKDASFGVKEEDIVSEYSPTSGATIIRDKFGVPHIYGETREATMFAIGYATAEDRMFLMDVLRHYGRARVSEFLGASEGNKAMDREQLEFAPYKEEELEQQADAICNQMPHGAQVCKDGEAYAEGVNAFINKAIVNPTLLPAEYPALQQFPRQWKLTDFVAIASLVGGIFGKGGGGEVKNGIFLSQLQQKYGEEEGRKIWEDFRSADDIEAPTTISKRFSYNNHKNIDPESIALLDLGTSEKMINTDKQEPIVFDTPFGQIRFNLPLEFSNALVLDGKHTDDGRPIAVFGPQTGYFTPQLLYEMDVHGPGIDARGVAFAGVNMYVQLGRGIDYAWSATSAGSDNVDQWVVKLCNPDGGEVTKDSEYYLYNGECRAMDVFNHKMLAKPTAAGMPEGISEETLYLDMKVARTVYGPVVSRATVNGEPVAVTTQRSTYGQELNSAIGFMLANDPNFMKNGATSFLEAFSKIEYVFNWFYVDEKDIAFQHSCLCPVRDPRTDPDLPTWGTGEYDWTGKFLTQKQQPHVINPPEGFLVSWNNKPALGFNTDDKYSYGPVHRSLMLEKPLLETLKSKKKLTRADMVNVTMEGATKDLVAQEVFPLVLEVLGKTAPNGGEQLQTMRDKLEEWVKTSGHRRDLNPQDGVYDHAVAIAIGDEFYYAVIDAMFGRTLRKTNLPNIYHDSPTLGLGSAYNNGYYGFIQKDLRQVLGKNVKDPWHKAYCGEGDLSTCRDLLWKAMGETADALAEEYGSGNVNDWVYDSSRDEIIQETLGVIGAPNIQWMNRPTFQQVVQVGKK